MFGIFARKHPGTVKLSNGVGFLCSQQHSMWCFFKTEILQVSSVLDETVFHAVLSMSFSLY